MSTGAISSQPVPVISLNQERRQDIRAIGQALAANDLQGAQQAFQALEQDFHRIHQSASGTIPVEIRHDLRALQTALKANDLQGAQQAFATFKADVQDLRPKAEVAPESPTGGLNVMG